MIGVKARIPLFNFAVSLVFAVSVISCTPRVRPEVGVSEKQNTSNPSTKLSARAKLDFENPPSLAELANPKTPPPTPEEASEQLEEAGQDWLYGGGVGRTMLNVGTIVLFPPYAIYVLGNAALQLSGYEPLYITDALPDKDKKDVLEVYDGVTSVPGRAASAVAGEEFREK